MYNEKWLRKIWRPVICEVCVCGGKCTGWGNRKSIFLVDVEKRCQGGCPTPSIIFKFVVEREHANRFKEFHWTKAKISVTIYHIMITTYVYTR